MSTTSSGKGPTWLRNLKMTKVDLVDRPADEHAMISLYKREGSPLAPDGTVLGDAFSENDAMLNPASPLSRQSREVTKIEQEGKMPELDEEILKGLPDEVLNYIGHLEQVALEKADDAADGEEEDEDMAKSLELPEGVQELLAKRDAEIEELRKSANDAQAVAKAERDLRVTREWRDKVTKLDSLSFEDTEAVVKSLKELADTNPELAEATFKTLSAANGQAESAALFSEIGKAAPAEGSAEAKLEKVVKGIMESEKVSEPEAWDLAIQRDPSLYADYVQEAR